MSIFRRNPKTAGRIIDELAFVVTAVDNKLHTLNSTGTELWRLAQRPEGATQGQAVDELVAKFEVSEELASKDVADCLRQFVQLGILIEE